MPSQFPRGVAPKHAATAGPTLGVSSSQDHDEEPALDAFAVGVLRREEPALRVLHLAQQVLERLDRDAPIAIVSG